MDLVAVIFLALFLSTLLLSTLVISILLILFPALLFMCILIYYKALKVKRKQTADENRRRELPFSGEKAAKGRDGREGPHDQHLLFSSTEASLKASQISMQVVNATGHESKTMGTSPLHHHRSYAKISFIDSPESKIIVGEDLDHAAAAQAQTSESTQPSPSDHNLHFGPPSPSQLIAAKKIVTWYQSQRRIKKICRFRIKVRRRVIRVQQCARRRGVQMQVERDIGRILFVQRLSRWIWTSLEEPVSCTAATESLMDEDGHVTDDEGDTHQPSVPSAEQESSPLHSTLITPLSPLRFYDPHHNITHLLDSIHNRTPLSHSTRLGKRHRKRKKSSLSSSSTKRAPNLNLTQNPSWEAILLYWDDIDWLARPLHIRHRGTLYYLTNKKQQQCFEHRRHLEEKKKRYSIQRFNSISSYMRRNGLLENYGENSPPLELDLHVKQRVYAIMRGFMIRYRMRRLIERVVRIQRWYRRRRCVIVGVDQNRNSREDDMKRDVVESFEAAVGEREEIVAYEQDDAGIESHNSIDSPLSTANDSVADEPEPGLIMRSGPSPRQFNPLPVDKTRSRIPFLSSEHSDTTIDMPIPNNDNVILSEEETKPHLNGNGRKAAVQENQIQIPVVAEKSA